MIGDDYFSWVESEIFEVGVEVSAYHLLVLSGNYFSVNHAVNFVASFVIFCSHIMNNFSFIRTKSNLFFKSIQLGPSEIKKLDDGQCCDLIKLVIDSVYLILNVKDGNIWVESFEHELEGFPSAIVINTGP